ncbi:MAG: M57 family metalloprotease [Chitinophagaceae bacterium]
MKRTTHFLMLLLMSGFVFTSCQKSTKDPVSEEISQDVIMQLRDLGYGTNNVQKVEEGYLVEGDMIITPEMLNSPSSSTKLLIANNEQYRTTNLVNAPRNITVSVSGSYSSGFSSAVDAAIARYNAESLQLTFSRVASGGNINIRIINTGQYIASAGFPSGGNPYNEIKYAKKYTTYSLGFMTTVLAHEMGHCIGFRHTDYMDRSYSCGTGGNEGASTVGAIQIPGTPSGPDAASWMLACLSATTNRPFNPNDKTALNYLY